MARLELKVKVDASELIEACDRLSLSRSSVLRKTLQLLRDHKRLSPRLYACIAWPVAWGKGGRALLGASGNAAQRLRAAAKAGLAHAAFEQGEETYEISSRGRAALGRTRAEPAPGAIRRQPVRSQRRLREDR